MRDIHNSTGFILRKIEDFNRDEYRNDTVREKRQEFNRDEIKQYISCHEKNNKPRGKKTKNAFCEKGTNSAWTDNKDFTGDSNIAFSCRCSPFSHPAHGC